MAQACNSSTLRKVRQEDYKFQAKLRGMGSLCLRKNKIKISIKGVEVPAKNTGCSNTKECLYKVA